MKDAEDEAFDELAKRQGGGYQAKRQMAADKQHWNEDEWRRNNWRCGHGWLRGEQCEICNAAQEPVAWMVYTQDGKSVYVTDNPTDIQEGQRALPLYTTPPQPVQEPVAYVTGMSFGRFIVEPLNRAMVLPVGMALYSSPQKNT